MGTTSLLTTAYNAVSKNEAGNATGADSILAPLDSGTSGWTIGFIKVCWKVLGT
jgi:hypothetical protein